MSDSPLRSLTLTNGEMIFHQDDPADGMYLIRDGRAELLKRDADGFYNTIGTLGPGQAIGEMGLITSRKRDHSARALGDCLLIEVSKSRMTQRLSEGDPFVKALYEILCQNLLSVLDRSAVLRDDNALDDFTHIG